MTAQKDITTVKLGVPFGIFEKFVLKRQAEVMDRCLETMNPGAKYEGLRFPFSPIAESIIVWDRFD